MKFQLACGTKQFDNALDVLETPADHPRPTARIFWRAQEPLALSLSLTQALKALSQRQGVSPFVTLLAAFEALLHRYTGQDDVLAGFDPVSSDRIETEKFAGRTANVQMLHTDLSGDPTFQELLNRVQDAIWETLRPGQTWNRASLPQVMFFLQNAPSNTQELSGLSFDSPESEKEGTSFGLLLSLSDTAQGLRGTIAYDADSFDAATIARTVGHYQTLLQGVVDHPEQRLSALPLLTGTERRQLLVDWNNTRTRYPQERCVHQLFEAQVEKYADAVAVAFEDQALTYRTLDRRANQLAHHLRALGVGPEVLVGISVERSPEMLVGILGILKAGGAYVPLDPTYPPERLAFMLKDAQTPVLLTQERLAARLPGREAHTVRLDADWETIALECAENPAPQLTADNLAYVIYTSGSTGRPKGVLVPHRGLPNVSQAHARSLGITSGDRVLQFASLSFDASTAEILMALGTGATLCTGTQQALLPGPDLARWLHDLSATFFTLPPSALAVLPVEEFPALRTVTVAGEACPVDLAARWAKGHRFFNLYGPTEATIWSTVAEYVEGGRKLPIGCPIANVQVYILDSRLQPMPVGAPGELYIGGVGLTRGYLNRPQLTAEKFVPHPFGGEPGARLYKTGDLARYLPDGNVEFLGRVDQQVKIRGFRVEVGEIEAALRRHAALRDAIVLAREDEPGVRRLVAYVVAQAGQAPAVGALRRWLQKQLPDYMIPSAFVFLDALPLTPNGKVDRRALPAPTRSRSELSSAYVAPRTPIEESLATIWGSVLGFEPVGFESVGIDDNFFELGSHSLAATQVLARIRETFQVELPLLCIFDAPTVAGLAQVIEAAMREQAEASQLLPTVQQSIQRAPRDGELPLALPQEQIWFIQQLYPDIMSYNAQATLYLKGRLNVPVLERSLGEIVRRHEIYRTTFPASGGRPIQVIHQPWQVSLPLVDLQVVPEGERETVLQQYLDAELHRPFDVTRLPLLRWTLLRLGDQEHVLIHVEHHFVHDGWSFNVFLRELLELYQTFCAGRPSPLPELPIQFADFACWQQEWTRGEAASHQLAYWREKLAGSLPLLELPTDRPRPAVPSFRGAAPRIELPVNLCQALRAFSCREGVTLFMTMLGAYLTLLHRYTGQEDISVGSGVANRRQRELEGLIGMLVNVIVLRTDLSDTLTFRELLHRVRRVTLEAYAHQDQPFERVVEAVQPERDSSYNPLFQAAFSFHDSPLPELKAPELTIEIVEGLSNGSAKFDLNVIAIPRSEQRIGQRDRDGAGGITMVWEYSTDLFDGATIERMIGHYRTILENIVADPEQRLSDAPLLTGVERRQIVVEWNDTGTDYPRDRCIHELFEAQVEQTPDATALIFGSEELTYRELNRRANQMAHHLRALGVGPEVLVGICMERSIEMVVGLVGVLKAGGAYVPLDPAYPPERLAFMVEDTGAPVLLTQARLAEQLDVSCLTPHASPRLVRLDADWAAIAQENEANPINDASADNLAYVMYTSGSTGAPKGVNVIHRNVARLVKETNYADLTAEEVFLQFAPISFDASTLEIWGCLLNGARLVVFPPHTPSLEELGQVLQQYRVTTLWLTAGLFHLMVDQRLEDMRNLHQLLAGGDVLSVSHVQQVLGEPGGCRMINGYGPTENTTFTCCYPARSDSRIGASVPIGQPIANTQVYVLDPHLQPVPVGVPGELYTGGHGLARGYLNRPGLTAERFIPHPFSAEPDARLYKTGDLVRYLPDGNIEFLGRIDHQVKIRGFRIELGEIETVLGEHTAVGETVVLAWEEEPGDKRLVAYVVPQDGVIPTAGELRGFLKDRLPEYMVPSAFVVLDALPLTPNGKVDRRTLPTPEWGRIGPEKNFVAPRTFAEEALAGIWAQILGVERVGIYDNFFEMGGHSLLATQIISRVRDAFQVELPLRYFFELPTVSGLAENIETVRRAVQNLRTPFAAGGDDHEKGEL